MLEGSVWNFKHLQLALLANWIAQTANQVVRTGPFVQRISMNLVDWRKDKPSMRLLNSFNRYYQRNGRMVSKFSILAIGHPFKDRGWFVSFMKSLNVWKMIQYSLERPKTFIGRTFLDVLIIQDWDFRGRWQKKVKHLFFCHFVEVSPVKISKRWNWAELHNVTDMTDISV